MRLIPLDYRQPLSDESVHRFRQGSKSVSPHFTRWNVLRDKGPSVDRVRGTYPQIGVPQCVPTLLAQRCPHGHQNGKTVRMRDFCGGAMEKPGVLRKRVSSCSTWSRYIGSLCCCCFGSDMQHSPIISSLPLLRHYLFDKALFPTSSLSLFILPDSCTS